LSLTLSQELHDTLFAGRVDFVLGTADPIPRTIGVHAEWRSGAHWTCDIDTDDRQAFALHVTDVKVSDDTSHITQPHELA
jgi:hypothetical protein